MNQNGRRCVGASAAGLVQAEHLEASSDRAEKYGWREEDVYVIVGQAQDFEAGGGCHFGCRSQGTSGARPLHVSAI